MHMANEERFGVVGDIFDILYALLEQEQEQYKEKEKEKKEEKENKKEKGPEISEGGILKAGRFGCILMLVVRRGGGGAVGTGRAI